MHPLRRHPNCVASDTRHRSRWAPAATLAICPSNHSKLAFGDHRMHVGDTFGLCFIEKRVGVHTRNTSNLPRRQFGVANALVQGRKDVDVVERDRNLSENALITTVDFRFGRNLLQHVLQRSGFKACSTLSVYSNPMTFIRRMPRRSRPDSSGC